VDRLLERIRSPEDVHRLDEKELPRLCQEIRERIIEVVQQNGGHLASSLGVVELTVALHRVFESPRDPIVWDVGNQSYAHKLLTGRADRFQTLRRGGGLSGFTFRAESVHDPFGAGHASTSISAALGIAEARRLRGEGGKVVAVIGDGGMTGGLAFEALNHAGSLERDLVVVLNDNGMFIAPRVGAMSTWLSYRLSGRAFNVTRRRIKEWLASFPHFGEPTVYALRRLVESAKVLLTRGVLFEGLNFQYLGPVDGHDFGQLIPILQNARALDGPVLVHVHTKKGKGLACAEKDPTTFHGVAPACANRRDDEEEMPEAASFTEVFSRALVHNAEGDPRLLAITAAMPDGTGLRAFAERFPERFFDVGIAEGHAVTFAAGLASQGFRPVVAVYSTFLQRAYDMILHDVCLQNLPVVFAIDRAGVVGEDGPTHHGAFDLSYLRAMPNLTVMAPADAEEFERMFAAALSLPGPAAIRYPRERAARALQPGPARLEIGRGRIVFDGGEQSKVAILALGSTVEPSLRAAEILKEQGIPVVVADARFLKPLDRRLVVELARRARLVTVEEGSRAGGFGDAVLSCLQEEGLFTPVLEMGIGDEFVPQGDRRGLLAALGLDATGIARAVRRSLSLPLRAERPA